MEQAFIRKLFLITALVLVPVGLATLSGCAKSSAAEKSSVAAKPAVPVTAADVTVKTIPVQIRAIGSVEPYTTVAIKTMIAGEITEVHYTDGQDVKKGDVLFTIDPRPYQADLQRAEANLSKDVALLKQAEANVARDEVQSKNAAAQAKRYNDLFTQGVISTDQNDQFRTTAEALDATVKADRAAVQSANENIGADKAAIESAKVQLSYCTVRSPVNGRTGSTMIQQGNVVKANDVALLVINQIEPIYVTFAVPEQQLAAIKQYMASGKLEVTATMPDDANKTETGTISFVDNTVDRTTGTIKLKGTFTNSDRKLWPGQYVTASLKLTTQADAVVIPSEAVQTGQKGQFVFIVKPDLTVDVQPVTIERTIDDLSVIKDGLKPGDKVITDGQLRLTPGAKVDIKNSISDNGGIK